MFEGGGCLLFVCLGRLLIYLKHFCTALHSQDSVFLCSMLVQRARTAAPLSRLRLDIIEPDMAALRHQFSMRENTGEHTVLKSRTCSRASVRW